jgi:nicotinate-nucleotide pyrophosphorylase (carboxylating)
MPDRDAEPLESLWQELAGTGLPRRLFELARDEDLGGWAGPGAAPGAGLALGLSAGFPIGRGGDLTSRVAGLADGGGQAAGALRTLVRAREPGVVAGLAACPLLAEVFGGRVSVELLAHDGDAVGADAAVARLVGPAGAVLALERTLLNLLGRLSGVATRTARFVAEVRGTGASIYDTRKTTPGLRVLEKYAVRCGGGRSHRLGLYDAVLIKDNHVAGLDVDGFAERVRTAAEAAADLRLADPGRVKFVMVEVDSIEQLKKVLGMEEHLFDIVLLDNFVRGGDVGRLREAVTLRAAVGSAVAYEASGGVRLENVRTIAETGVERISIGGLTHQAVGMDFGLDAE